MRGLPAALPGGGALSRPHGAVDRAGRLLEDEAGRKALQARFLFAQQFFQIDPWAARAEADAPAAREFRTLAEVE